MLRRALFLLCLGELLAAKSPVTQTILGKVKGAYLKSGSTWAEVYHSIPYALPIDALRRFEAPTPGDNWPETLDVTKDTSCYELHFNATPTKKAYSEDCLRIKLVVPNREKGKRFGHQLPLIIWLHGGSFRTGSRDFYKDHGIIKNFARNKIAFAAIDFRLGFEGFLSNGDKDLPGNLALEDVRLGIEFLKANAAEFGIDNDRITIAGEGSGGSMASFVAASPKFFGLRAKVFMASGFATSSWANRNKFTVRNSRDVFAACKCALPSSAEVKACLKKVDPSCYRGGVEGSLSFAKDQAHSMDYEAFSMGLTAFTPVVDAYSGLEALVPAEPHELLRRSDSLPALISLTAHETYLSSAAQALRLKSAPDEWLDSFMPEKYNASSTVRRLLAERYGPNGSTPLLDRFLRASQEQIEATAHGEALLYSRRQDNAYVLVNNIFAASPSARLQQLATSHGADMCALFESDHFCGRFPTLLNGAKSARVKFARHLMSIVAEFVHTGKVHHIPHFARSTRQLTEVSSHGLKTSAFDAESFYFWTQLVPTLARFNLHLDAETAEEKREMPQV